MTDLRLPDRVTIADLYDLAADSDCSLDVRSADLVVVRPEDEGATFTGDVRECAAFVIGRRSCGAVEVEWPAVVREEVPR